MKQIRLLDENGQPITGGRPFNNDDLVMLQAEAAAAAQAPFLGKGPFILSGCSVTGTSPTANVSAGIVFLDGQLLRFAGQSGVTLPAQFQAGAVVFSDPRPYQTGGTKDCVREVPAVLVASNPAYTAGEFLPLDTWGGKRWEHVQRASVRSLSEVQQIANLNAAHYQSGFTATDGLGLPGTEAWGWALCNGLNGTADLRGMFVLGYNPNRGNDGRGNNITANSIGDVGGKESITLVEANLPPNPAGTGNVATFVGGNQGNNLTNQGTNGWVGQQPRAGTSAPIDARPPHIVLGMRQWVGY